MTTRVAFLALTLLLAAAGCSTSERGGEGATSDTRPSDSVPPSDSVAPPNANDSTSSSVAPGTDVESTSPSLNPGIVAAGELVEITTTQNIGVGYTISQLNFDGVFVTRWGVISDGNPGGDGSLTITDELYEFGYEDVGVPAERKSRIPTPADAEPGLYAVCADNNPELECLLLGIGEPDATDVDLCGSTCDGIEPGDNIPLGAFQPAYGWIRDDQITFFAPLNRQRPDTFILETRDATSGWRSVYRLISHPYSFTDPNTIETTIGTIGETADREPEIIEADTHPVGRTWDVPPDLAGTEARVCSIEAERMGCLYWRLDER